MAKGNPWKPKKAKPIETLEYDPVMEALGFRDKPPSPWYMQNKEPRAEGWTEDGVTYDKSGIPMWRAQ